MKKQPKKEINSAVDIANFLKRSMHLYKQKAEEESGKELDIGVVGYAALLFASDIIVTQLGCIETEQKFSLKDNQVINTINAVRNDMESMVFSGLERFRAMYRAAQEDGEDKTVH
jgi:hypothetical protein